MPIDLPAKLLPVKETSLTLFTHFFYAASANPPKLCLTFLGVKLCKMKLVAVSLHGCDNAKNNVTNDNQLSNCRSYIEKSIPFLQG